VAVGTTVVRALEHAAMYGEVRADENVATQRIGHNTRLRVVDVILSGTHEPGTSHYELLRAFIPDSALGHLTRDIDTRAYRTHEFGDSVLVSRPSRAVNEKPQTCQCDQQPKDKGCSPPEQTSEKVNKFGIN